MNIRLVDKEWKYFDSKGVCIGNEVTFRAKALAAYHRLQDLHRELQGLGLDWQVLQELDRLETHLRRELIRDAKWLEPQAGEEQR